MATELRQLCDLWEFSVPEQETSGHLSKWGERQTDLTDHEHMTGREHLSEAHASP